MPRIGGRKSATVVGCCSSPKYTTETSASVSGTPHQSVTHHPASGTSEDVSVTATAFCFTCAPASESRIGAGAPSGNSTRSTSRPPPDATSMVPRTTCGGSCTVPRIAVGASPGKTGSTSET
ncbi:hypothetical protein [Nocardia crassostreae]|uniref:hypothetical protein n=1 Tax=Nocardia crassostreae TaxID=53428 RepID=UPI0012FA02B1|nr:hypothetical protein [Nocardia crassostreae]